jgi:hypothetical protein
METKMINLGPSPVIKRILKNRPSGTRHISPLGIEASGITNLRGIIEGRQK